VKLIKCYVSSFGKLKDFTYDFNGGLNTIKEDNGWGKSTLATFIKVMFYGISGNKRSVSENDRLKYRPWNSTEKFGGAVWFEWGGKQYKIERFFGQKETEDQVSLYDVETGKAYQNTENLGKRIFEIDEEGFLSTTYFAQKEFEAKSNSSITAKFNAVCEIQNSEDFDHALLKIEEQAKKYKYRGDKGIIPDLKREVFNVDEQIAKANNSVVTYNRLKEEIAELEKEVLELQKESKKLTERVGVAGKIEAEKIKRETYEKLKVKKAEIQERIISAQKILNGKDISEQNVLVIKEKLREKEKIEERINSIKQDLSLMSEKVDNANKKSNKAIDIICYSVSVIGVVAGLILLLISSFKSIIGWAFFGVFICAIIVKFILSKINKNVKNNDAFRSMIEEKNNELIQLENYRNALKVQIDNFINGFSLDNAYDDNTALDYLQRLLVAKESFRKDLNSLDAEIIGIERSFGDFNLLKTENEDVLTLNQKLKEIQDLYTKKSIELANNKAKMEMHEEIASSFPDLESKKFELGEKINQSEEEYKILTLTYKYLKLADENLKIRYRKPLQESLNKYYNYVSDIEKDVQIDIDLNVTIDESGVQKVVDYYSKGYQNLFEICKRFALTDVLFTGEKPFIILDDPFYNLDDKKLKSALELIKKLAKDYQIIYLVCHESRVV